MYEEKNIVCAKYRAQRSGRQLLKDNVKPRRCNKVEEPTTGF